MHGRRHGEFHLDDSAALAAEQEVGRRTTEDDEISPVDHRDTVTSHIRRQVNDRACAPAVAGHQQGAAGVGDVGVAVHGDDTLVVAAGPGAGHGAEPVAARAEAPAPAHSRARNGDADGAPARVGQARFHDATVHRGVAGASGCLRARPAGGPRVL